MLMSVDFVVPSLHSICFNNFFRLIKILDFVSKAIVSFAFDLNQIAAHLNYRENVHEIRIIVSFIQLFVTI